MTGYYQALLNSDGTYGTILTSAETPILVVPKKWEDIEVEYSRHPEYLGVFRSQSQTFSFVEDARAILLNLYYKSNGGIQAECTLRVDIFYGVKIGYKTAYVSQLNFSDCNDIKFNNGGSYNPIKTGFFEIPTLDSELFTLVESVGGTDMNIPVWDKKTGGGWETDCDFLFHEGIKLLYNSTFTSSASPESPLTVRLWGFNLGQFGSFPNAGTHYLPAMNSYNIVQANGTTTYIGNDILQDLLIQNRQSFKEWEIKFNDAKPYTTDNNLLYNLLNNSVGFVSMEITVNYEFSNPIAFSIPIADYTLIFVLFELDKDNNPLTIGGNYVYTTLATVPITDSSGTNIPLPVGPQSGTNTKNIAYDRCYCLGIISDTPTGTGEDPASAGYTGLVEFSNLQVTFKSSFNSGTSIPVDAPSLPASAFPVIKLNKLLDKVVKNLTTTQTDGYGFPIQVSSSYEGVSGFLDASNTLSEGDAVPYQIGWSSQYCIHNLQGQSYFSVGLNKLFNFCKNALGCGMSIEGNKVRIESLSYYFNKDKEILNLDDFGGVSMLSIKPFNDLGGCNLKLGYKKSDTNSDFGVEPFNTELFFNTPLTKNKNTIEIQETEVLTEQYEIEKIRAQKVNQPVGTVYDPANPSSDNQNVAFYCQPTKSYVITAESGLIRDPDNQGVNVLAYKLNQRPTAQSINSLMPPYIYGMRYPDTAYNLELSPCRMLERGSGALLRSVLDLMDDKYLVFRNTTVLQYNNTVVGLSGIESNLGSGVITEFKDIKIGNLPDALFRPYIFELTTVSPVNMYEIINSDPNGYISFTWKGFKFMGFIWNIKQKLAASAPTRFQLIAHPSTTNNQLICS